MYGRAVGRASRLPLGRLAPQSLGGETPGQTAGTAAPLQNRGGSWSQGVHKSGRGLSRNLVAKDVSPLTLDRGEIEPTDVGCYQHEPIHGLDACARAEGAFPLTCGLPQGLDCASPFALSDPVRGR